ncbi:hypothetical protein SAMN04487843_101339 [Methylobacterium sp. ap11]|uniref:hypothetical protein n=1 Tax=Methylobacterium sp. ap11 TaxID=1761799 RepID=UPI0008B72AE6|nr:hypothetical protein [Methylobacterium sp. ap11]SEO42254.1 hypothetical protein SAMN04487843_101339 [Methylobacterium sp. ap11]
MNTRDAASPLPIGPNRVARTFRPSPVRRVDPEREQARGAALRRSDFARFRHMGLEGAHLACGRYGADILLRDVVVFEKRQRFRFARDDNGPGTGAEPAYTIPARDIDGEVVDVVAWHPPTGRLSSWLGRVGLLGEDSLWRPLGSDEPLLVHRDPFAWLKASWRGVVVVHPGLARAALLEAGTLLTTDLAHAETINALLRRQRLPRILVKTPAVGVAA